MSAGLMPPEGACRRSLLGGGSFRLPPACDPSGGPAEVAVAVDRVRGSGRFAAEVAAPLGGAEAVAAMATVRSPLGAAFAEAAAGSSLVAVFGDYDVDGVTSVTTLLFGLLAARFGDARRAVAEWDRHGLLGAGLLAGFSAVVPERRHGYGVSAQTMAGFARAGVATLVCCDNGTNALDAMRAARKAGLRVLVVDHHPPSDAACAFWNVPPPGFSIVNPWLPGPFSDAVSGWSSGPNLCACAVAAGVVAEVWDRLGVDGLEGEPRDRIVAMAAVATVADVMPLLGVNRGLVMDGLAALDSGSCPAGLTMVRDDVFARRRIGIAEGRVDWAGCAIDTDFVGFQLGPRLNACGRMGDAASALRLLASGSGGAVASVEIVEAMNALRKEALEEALVDAQAMAQDAAAAAGAIDVVDWSLAAADGRAGPGEIAGICKIRGDRQGRVAYACVVPGVLVLFVSSSMGDGLAGLVAGRLAESMGVVAIAMSFRESKFYVQMSGSGRVPQTSPMALLGGGVPGAVVAAAMKVSGSGGGHAAAFGLRVRPPADVTEQARAMRGFATDCALRLLTAFGSAVRSGAIVPAPSGPQAVEVDLSFPGPAASRALASVPALGPFGRDLEEPLVHVEVGPTACVPMGATGAAIAFDPVGRSRRDGLRMIGFSSSFAAGDPAFAAMAARLSTRGGGLVGRVVRSFYGNGEFARGGSRWSGPRTELKVEAVVEGEGS